MSKIDFTPFPRILILLKKASHLKTAAPVYNFFKGGCLFQYAQCHVPVM